MIESYKEGKKGDLKLLKSRLRSAKVAAHQQAMRRTQHHSWNEAVAHEKVGGHHHHHHHHQGHVTSAVDPQQVSTIQLWPPFSVANVPMQVKPVQTVAGATTSMVTTSVPPQMSRIGPSRAHSEQPQPSYPPSQPPMYSNLIPAYYIPHQMSSNQKASGGYFVSMPTFIQQPLQFLQAFQGSSVIYQPVESHAIGSNFVASPQIRPGGSLPENRGGVMPNHPGMTHHHRTTIMSPDRQNSMSIDSSIMEEPQRGQSHEKLSSIDRGTIKKAFKFQRPSSRTGSRATSVKAEPGSALESNLESNASVSASVGGVKLVSPGGGFMASSSRASGGLQEQVMESTTDSSLCSLMKSSDDFTPTTSNGSEDDEKDGSSLARPILQDPFWLTNVNMTPQLTFNYQIKLKKNSDILKRDLEILNNMNQPNQVEKQLSQLYREFEETGEVIRPLLEADANTSCTSTSSSSTGEDSEENAWKYEKQKQVILKKMRKCTGIAITLHF